MSVELYLIYLAFIFQRTPSSNELLLLIIDGLWKGKAIYLVLRVDASVKFQNLSGASRQLE